MKKLTAAKAHNILSYYLASLGYKEKTIKNHSRKIDRFFDYLTETAGIQDIRDVNESVLKRFLTWLNEMVSERTRKVLAASSKREIYSIIKLLFRGLYVGEFILVNPMQNIVYTLKEAHTQREILTENEMNRFLDGIDEEKPCGLRDRAMFELMYSSGLRAGDITHDLHENIRRVYKSFHPRENEYFREVDEVYLERIQGFKEVLSEQKGISRKRREIKKRFYEKNRDKILKKMKQEYRDRQQKKKDLTKE